MTEVEEMSGPTSHRDRRRESVAGALISFCMVDPERFDKWAYHIGRIGK
jgi:hypothetical protein